MAHDFESLKDYQQDHQRLLTSCRPRNVTVSPRIHFIERNFQLLKVSGELVQISGKFGISNQERAGFFAISTASPTWSRWP